MLALEKTAAADQLAIGRGMADFSPLLIRITKQMLAPTARPWDFCHVTLRSFFVWARSAVAAALIVSITSAVLAQDSSTIPFEQKIDVVFGEVHGTGLLMDVFAPKA